MAGSNQTKRRAGSQGAGGGAGSVSTVAGVSPTAGDVPAADLATALADEAGFTGAFQPVLNRPVDIAAFNAIYGTGITSYDVEFNTADTTSLPSGWSWVNQETASYRERFGAGTLTVPSAALEIRGIVRALPSESTWTATMWATGSQIGNAASDAELFGLILRDSATGKNAMLRRASTSGVITTKSANDNFGTAANFSAARFTYANGLLGFRVKRNSATSYDFQFSADGGISWSDVDMARDMSAHFTPDQIGFFALQSLGWQCEYSIHSFRVR